MSLTPYTERKLQQARETFQVLQASARAIPLQREVVEGHLSDFLSKAYSVVDVLRDEIGDRLVDRWWSMRSVEDQALKHVMREQRRIELHHRGAAVNTTLQEISYSQYLLRTEWKGFGGSNGRSCFCGPVGMGLPPSVTITILTLEGEEVTERCTRYLRLLEQMVQAFLAAPPPP